MIPKTKFFEENGTRLVRVSDDNAEGGDFMLFHPEEKWAAAEYIKRGYAVASVFETDSEDAIAIDNDISEHPYKIGYLVLEKQTHG